MAQKAQLDLHNKSEYAGVSPKLLLKPIHLTV